VTGTLIFDGNCGFCTRSRNFLVRLDRKRRIRTVPYQRQGTAEAAGVSLERLATEVCFVDAAGTPAWGAAAVNAALGTALGIRLPTTVYRLPGIRGLQDRLYRWVSANRHRLPGTTPWCEDHPADCAGH
jgi:predicted DCC family thiol-disulfide oxidoreductase YuxK